MSEESRQPAPKRKGVVRRWLEKLDRKLQEKARQQPCCGGQTADRSKSSCC